MDRKPLPPPFPVGTRLRYVGTHNRAYVGAGDVTVPYQAPGLEVEIVKVQAGYRGTMRQIHDEAWYDTDEPILDTTRDGYSVYEVEVPGCGMYGRCIDPRDAHEWEVLD